jgi:hypothetical protein
MQPMVLALRPWRAINARAPGPARKVIDFNVYPGLRMIAATRIYQLAWDSTLKSF